jgi:virulence-associated protein VapD
MQLETNMVKINLAAFIYVWANDDAEKAYPDAIEHLIYLDFARRDGNDRLYLSDKGEELLTTVLKALEKIDLSIKEVVEINIS